MMDGLIKDQTILYVVNVWINALLVLPVTLIVYLVKVIIETMIFRIVLVHMDIGMMEQIAKYVMINVMGALIHQIIVMLVQIQRNHILSLCL